MLVLGIDTAFYHLTLALIKDDVIIDRLYETCQRHQSELLVGRIDEMLKRNKLKPTDLTALVVTKGPGSYTGMRIALTFAKVFCTVNKVDLFTLSTLQLYAGKQSSLVIIDARASRCYLGVYRSGQALQADSILELSQLTDLGESYPDFQRYGDWQLVGETANFSDCSGNFLALKDYWERVDNIQLLAPEYLKEQSAYGEH